MSAIKFIKENKEIIVAKWANVFFLNETATTEIYTFKGKLMNCGGYGQCGMCVVEIVEGMDNLSPRTEFENRKLAKKPANYRLACQTLVNGAVCVNTKP